MEEEKKKWKHEELEITPLSDVDVKSPTAISEAGKDWGEAPFGIIRGLEKKKLEEVR